MNPVYITRMGAFLPNDPVNNEEMEGVLGLVSHKPSRARRPVLRSNGIKARYYAIDKKTGKATHTNAQLTAAAIEQLAQGDFSLNQIDFLACGTTVPDQLAPNHAVMVHGELGIPACEVVATSGICLAGISALKYAYLSVAAGESRFAVATGSDNASASLRGQFFGNASEDKVDQLEKHPELAFEKDFLRWMLSDGAGAFLLQPHPTAEGISLKIEWIYHRSYAHEMETCMYLGAMKQSDGRLQGWRSIPPDRWHENDVFAVKQDVKLLNEAVVHYNVERTLSDVIDIYALKADDINPAINYAN